MTFDPLALLRRLVEHDVRFVVIGQVAALLHGHPEATFDLDVVPEQEIENAERLIAVLRELDGHLVIEGTPSTAAPDERDLLGWNQIREYDTTSGPIDVIPFAVGVGDYRVLMGSAVPIDLDGMTVWVASLDDIITSKGEAGRPKDLRQLPALRAFRDRRTG